MKLYLARSTTSALPFLTSGFEFYKNPEFGGKEYEELQG